MANKTYFDLSAKGLFFRLFASTSVACLSGCALLPPAVPHFPDAAQLEAGDVLITFAGGASSLLFSTPEQREGERPYSHAEVVLPTEKREWQLAGVSGSHVGLRPLLPALAWFDHVAVYRLKASATDRNRAAEIARTWTQDPLIRKAAFDYSFQDIPGRRDRFSCVGFVNEVYREAHLPVPFPVPARPPHPLEEHLAALTGKERLAVAYANTVLNNPEWAPVLFFATPHASPEAQCFQRAFVATVLRSYRQGWRLKTGTSPGLLFRLSVLTGFQSAEAEKPRATLNTMLHYADRVQRDLARVKRRYAPNEKETAEWMEQLCARYRTRYMERHAH